MAYAISLPAWIYTLLGNNISSGSPDVTSSCLMIHLFLTFAAFIMTADMTERIQLFGALLLLGAVCLCVKLNTLGMVAGVCGVAVLFLVLEKDISCFRSTRALVGAAAAVILLGCWVYRGVLISGYPLFPSPAMAVSVAWKMKESDADQCREDTVYWARIPYGDRKVALEGFSWLRPWIKRVVAMDIRFNWPIGIGLVGAAALSLMSWMEIRLRKGSYFMVLLCAPLAIAYGVLAFDRARAALFWIRTLAFCDGADPWTDRCAGFIDLSVRGGEPVSLRCSDGRPYLGDEMDMAGA